MDLLQLIEAVGEAWSRWAGAHPVRAVLAVVAVVIGSTVTVKRLELPVYKWARDWLNARLDGLGKRLNAGLDSKVSGLTETVAMASVWRRRVRRSWRVARSWDSRSAILFFKAGLDRPSSMDPNYIYGACNYMFRRLHENFPNARIICILQPANYSDKMEYPDDATAQTLGFANLAEMQTWDIYSFGQYKMECKERAVKECAERFGIHIVDCIFDWYSVVNPTQRAKYWDADKIHLSGEGTRALAAKLDREGILEIFGK